MIYFYNICHDNYIVLFIKVPHHKKAITLKIYPKNIYLIVVDKLVPAYNYTSVWVQHWYYKNYPLGDQVVVPKNSHIMSLILSLCLKSSFTLGWNDWASPAKEKYICLSLIFYGA